MQSLPDFMTTGAKMSSYVQVRRVSFVTYLKRNSNFTHSTVNAKQQEHIGCPATSPPNHSKRRLR